MKNEYIIINKTAIQKRIEELEEGQSLSEKVTVAEGILLGGIFQLKQILAQSTPLIPEIEKAFDKGGIESENSYFDSKGYRIVKQDYISNLKLDI